MKVTNAITLILAAALLFVIIYGAPVLLQIYRYNVAGDSVKADHVDWTVQTINDEEFRPEATFSYTVDGKHYEKKELFQGEKYRNPYTAKDELKTLAAKYDTVWYRAAYPEEGTLERFYPTKKAFYLGILFALTSYGIWIMKYYVDMIKRK